MLIALQFFSLQENFGIKFVLYKCITNLLVVQINKKDPLRVFFVVCAIKDYF